METGKATITSSQGGTTAAILVDNEPGIAIQNLMRAGPATQYGIQVASTTSGVIQNNDVGVFTTTSSSDAAADIYVGSSTMLVYGNRSTGFRVRRPMTGKAKLKPAPSKPRHLNNRTNFMLSFCR